MSMGLRDQLLSTLAAELRVATARGCNTATETAPPTRARYGHLTVGRLSSDLATAIREACRARGDSNAQCQALIADCESLNRADRLDLLEHFRGEALRADRVQPPGAKK